jgi:hypothetical protein
MFLVRKHLKRGLFGLYWSSYANDELISVIAYFTFFLSCAAVILAPVVVSRLLKPHLDVKWQPVIGLLVLYICILFLIHKSIDLVRSFGNRARSKEGTARQPMLVICGGLAAILLSLGLVVRYQEFHSNKTPLDQGILLVLASGLICATTFSLRDLLVTLEFPIYLLLKRRGRHFYPRSRVVASLCDLALDLDRGRRRRDDSEFRAHIIWLIEAIAVDIECVGSETVTFDQKTARSVSEFYGKIAAGVRRWKRDILLNESVANDRLLSEVTCRILQVAEDHWSKIPQGEPAAAPSAFAVAPLTVVGRVLMVLMIPIIALVSINHFLSKHNGATASYIRSILAIWVLTNVISVVDPGFYKRITALQQAKGSLGKD